MSEPFIAEIRMFAGSFAPRSWAFCNGQLMSINQNSALFSLLGTIYGGDGRSTFALPEMRGRLPMHQGTGPGLSYRPIGARLGAEGVTLATNQMPQHNHSFNTTHTIADSSNPANDVLAAQNDGDMAFTEAAVDQTTIQSLNSKTIASAGSNKTHTNMMPYQSVSFIIALLGIYPSRN